MKFLIIMIICFALTNVYAQFGSFGTIDARSQGLAGTSNSIARGVYSIGINPANLSIDKNDFIDFTTVLPFPSTSVNSGTNFITINDINYYFGGVNGESRLLTEDDKQRFNSLLSGGGLVFINASFSLFSFGINISEDVGAFAISVQDIAGAKLYIPESLSDIALNGNQQGRTYDLDDTNLKAWWIRNYSLSYSRIIAGNNSDSFDKLTFGVTGKFITGYSYIGTEKVNCSFATGQGNQITGQTDLLGYSAFSDMFGVKYDFDSVKQKSSLGLFPSPAGTGYGFDLGIAGKTGNWGFSIALTDIGKITWNNNAAQFSSFGDIYIDDLSNQEQLDTLENRLTGDSQKIHKFTTSLPTALRAGAHYSFDNGIVPGSLLLALDIDQGFNNLPGNSKYPRLSFGAEWKPMDWIPYFRTGISYNSELGIGWGFGVGIDIKIVELHFASSDMQSFITPNHSRHLSFSFGSRWKFN